MIAQETWHRFLAHWPKLMLAGLFAVLLYGIVALVATLTMVPMMVAAGLGMGGAMTGEMGGAAAMLTLIGGMLGIFLVLMLIAIAVSPLATGGLIHTVIQVQRDEPAAPGDFWQAGFQHYGKLLKLMLLTLVIWVPVGLVLGILSLIPVVGALIGLVAALMLGVVLGGYAPYVALAENLSASEALSKAFRILTTRTVDVLLAGLVLLAAGICFGIVSALVNLVPGVGFLVSLVLQVAVTPLVILYLATRYQTNIAPAFPPGGTFHVSPPPGP